MFLVEQLSETGLITFQSLLSFNEQKTVTDNTSIDAQLECESN
jgi:hypothetical protein